MWKLSRFVGDARAGAARRARHCTSTRDWVGLEPLAPRVLLSAAHAHVAPEHDGDSTAVVVESALPHRDNPEKQQEHLALLDLVSLEDASHSAVRNGLWSEARTWKDGVVPGALADVVIPQHTAVVYDQVSTEPFRTIRVDGTLRFDTTRDTELRVDTLVVATEGTLLIGTEDVPIAAGVGAKIVFADLGPIDTARDPQQLGRGLVSHGTVRIHGALTTPFLALAEPARKGDTVLVLAQAPVNWTAGDRLVLTGTSPSRNRDEALKILGITGARVKVAPLAFDHRAPAKDLFPYVANVSRNVVLISENARNNKRRGHVMFMHSPKVSVHHAGFYGLGRTDKRNPVDDPRLDDAGRLIEGTGLNPRGRYAVHFHRNGDDIHQQPALVAGSVVVDSPGWGFVNHQSHVVMEDNVAFDVAGAAFVTEHGDEVGAFRRNIAIRSQGSPGSPDRLDAREELHDFGHGGHGFWLQGAGIEVEDNVAAGQRGAAFVYFTRSRVATFAADNLPDASATGGAERIPVGNVPIRSFKRNTAFASGEGFESWFHLLTAPRGTRSVVEDLTVWNVKRRAVRLQYTSRLTLRNVRAIRTSARTGGVAVGRNKVTANIHYENLHIRGWGIGILAPLRGKNVIQGGTFKNVTNIKIEQSAGSSRVIDIAGDITFRRLSRKALGGRRQHDIHIRIDLDLKDRNISDLFKPDSIRLGVVRVNGRQLYARQQAAGFVPFKAGTAPDHVPDELIGKTNRQLRDQYGLALGGAIAPADATTDVRTNGLIGAPSGFRSDPTVKSRRQTNRLRGYRLVYRDGNGNVVRDRQSIDLAERWNLITREVNGGRTTFFVYGDVTPARFVPRSKRALVIHPGNLDTGIRIRGQVLDGTTRKHVTRFFSGEKLSATRIQSRPDGSRFIALKFKLWDRAGNRTDVAMEVTLDPQASLNPLSAQKKLNARNMSQTLAALLASYVGPSSGPSCREPAGPHLPGWTPTCPSPPGNTGFRL